MTNRNRKFDSAHKSEVVGTSLFTGAYSKQNRWAAGLIISLQLYADWNAGKIAIRLIKQTGLIRQRFFFSARVADLWNDLDDGRISVDTINSF